MMRNIGITMVSLALLSWVAACAGTDGMMEKKMDREAWRRYQQDTVISRSLVELKFSDCRQCGNCLPLVCRDSLTHSAPVTFLYLLGCNFFHVAHFLG